MAIERLLWRLPLGLLVLAPAGASIFWLELTPRLLPTTSWHILLGLPAGIALLALSTFVTSRKGPGFAARQLLASVVALVRSPPPPRQALRSTLAALGEELLFRLLGLAWLGVGALGLTVTTGLFALSHLIVARPGRRLVTVVDAALCGLLLAGLYLATGGLLVAVVAHLIRNLALDALRGARRAGRAEPVAQAPEEAS